MSFDADTLKIRKPLWIALSDLFLDTELQDYHHNHIAKVMHDSGYTFAEIEDILMLEVLPVCIANLHSVAGEWAGFHEDWVIKTIVKSKRPNRFRRWMNQRSFWMIKDDWEKVFLAYGRLLVDKV